MARRRRRTLEERIAALEEQLPAQQARRRTYGERLTEQGPIARQPISRRLRRRPQLEAAWERLSVAAKLKHKKRDLGKLVAEWETRDERPAQRVPYRVRLGFSEGHYRHRRLSIEADILELEGAPAERIARLRWAANEMLRLGRQVSPDEYENAHAPPPVPAAALVKEVNAHEPSEWRPRPRERDVLADYRDQRLNRPEGIGSYEPEVV